MSVNDPGATYITEITRRQVLAMAHALHFYIAVGGEEIERMQDALDALNQQTGCVSLVAKDHNIYEHTFTEPAPKYAREFTPRKVWISAIY